MSRDKKAYYIQDDSPSSVKAVVSDNSRIDPDSSIEFLGHQRSSPHSRALRHIALAQANLLEANKHTTNGLCASTVSICSSLSSSITSTSRQVQLPYARRRIPFMRSPSPLQERSYTTSSDARDPKTEKKPIYSPELDWDDPVLNPAARSRMPSTPSSESSELPELPFKGTSANTATAKSVTLSCMESDARLHSGKAPLPPTSATWRSANTSNRREVDPAKVKRLRNAGRQHFRAERKARLQMKQAKEEELKDKFRTFSYDSTTAITPKIWYYRGLASGQIKFMGCDTRAGFSFDQPRSLEDVLSGLQGYVTPLHWRKKGHLTNSGSPLAQTLRLGFGMGANDLECHIHEEGNWQSRSSAIGRQKQYCPIPGGKGKQ